VLQEEGILYEIGEIRRLISLARKDLPKNFWKRVAIHIPLRSVESVYDHARRRLSSKNYKGKWSPEDIFKLKKLVSIYGRQWTKIGANLNRLPGACYDKWRDALKSGEKRKKGKWVQQERCKLLQLIIRQTGHDTIQEQGVEKMIRWTVVAEKIGTRSYLQCRNEWARFFSPGSKVKLNFFDCLKLLEAISLLEVADETEIKWGELLEGVPAHKTYNKWRSLCRKFLKNHGEKFNLKISFKNAVFVIKERLPNFLFRKKAS